MNTSYMTRTADPSRAHQRSAEPATTAYGIGPFLGLTATEAKRASIGNYVRAVVTDDKHELGFFAELSEATEKAAQASRRGPGTYYAPADALGPQRRDMGKATASAGGYLIDAGVKGFAAALDAAGVIGRLPMTQLPNMVGDAKITRETVKGTANWLADETTQISDVQSTFDQMSLTMKSLAGAMTVSSQLVKQAGPTGNAFIERAGAVTVAEARDRALASGSGNSGAPLGLLNVSGIDSRAGTSFALADAAAMLRVAEGYASDDSIRWLCGVAAAEDLRCRLKSENGGETLMDEQGRMLGLPVVVSRSVPDQVLICMPWSQLWYATWGALEVGVDPFTNFRDGKIIVRFVLDCDFGVERGASVAVATALS
jgi:HK97 family phage major capsid protein